MESIRWTCCLIKTFDSIKFNFIISDKDTVYPSLDIYFISDIVCVT